MSGSTSQGQGNANLGINIDSSSVGKATQALTDFRTAADGAGRANQQYVQQLQTGSAANQSFRDATQQLTQDLGGMVSQLDVLMQRLSTAQQNLRSGTEAFKEFSAVRGEVENLGRAFGITSTNVTAYYQAAQNVAFTSGQTVTSLQRITEALQNQTVVGQQVRKVMQDYGVEMSTFEASTNGAVKALQAFVDKMRLTADGPQKFRSASAVLGPMDLDSFGKLSDPDYVTLDERRRRTAGAAQDAYNADRTRNADISRRQATRLDTEYNDLLQTYFLGAPGYHDGFDTSGSLNDEQRASLRKQAGLGPVGNGLGTQADQVKMLEYLRDHPDSDLAKAALRRDSATAWNQSPLGRFSNYFFKGGGFAANDQEILGDQQAEMGTIGPWTALGNRISRTWDNFTGTYKPDPAKTDTRAADPIAKLLADQNQVAGLANVGDYGPALRSRNQQMLDSYFKSSATDPRQPGNDSTRDNLKRLTTLYGESGGTARFLQLQGEYTYGRDTALDQGRPLQEQNDRTGYIQSQRPSERGMAEAYFSYMREMGLNPAPTIADAKRRNISAGDLKGGAAQLQGDMTPPQRAGFQQYYDTYRGNQTTAFTDQFWTQLAQQQSMTQTAPQGSGALEDLTTKYQAINQAVHDKLDIEQQNLLVSQAQLQLDEKRKTQIAEQTGEMQRQVDAAKNLTEQLAKAGDDPVAQAEAKRRAAQDQAYAQAKAANPQYTRAAFDSQQNPAIAANAVAGGQAIQSNAAAELRQQQELLTVAGARADLQAKYLSDQKVGLEFADKLGAARAVGDKAAEESIQRQIQATKDFLDQLRAVTQETKNATIARDNNDTAAYNRMAAGISDPQRRRAVLMNRDNYLDNREAGTNGGNPLSPATGNTYGIVPAPAGSNGGQNGAVSIPSLGSSSSASSSNGGLVTQETNGIRYTIAAPFATAADGFLRELAASGYDIKSVQGYNNRSIAGTNTLSWHALGAAFDVNPSDNPVNGGTNLPGNVAQMAAKYGLGWGGNWTGGKTDPMHFSFAANEGGAFNIDRSGGLGQYGSPAFNQRRASVENADDANADVDIANSRDRFTAEQRARQNAMRLRAQGLTGDAARAEQNFTDPTQNAKTQAEQNRQRGIGVITGQQDAAGQQSAATNQSIADQKRLADAYRISTEAGDALLKKLQAEKEAREAGAGVINVQLRALQLYNEAAAALNQKMGQQEGTNARTIEQNKAMAEAWGRGAQAAGEMQRSLELLPIEKAIEQLRKQGVAVDDLVAKLAKLKKGNEDVAGSAAGSDLQKKSAGLSDQNDLARQDNARGPFLSDQSRDRANMVSAREQQLANLPADTPDSAKDRYRQQTDEQQTIKENTQRVNEYRQAWKGAEDAAFSALNTVIVNGGSAKDVAKGLVKELANIALSVLESPIKKGLSDMFSAAVMSGQGNAWDGGSQVRMFASGGLIDRPTKFFSAGGQANVAGEVGTEGILPLRRMPNGDLGVSTNSGGSGVTVNAPITINGGGGGSGGSSGGGMDQATVNALHSQLKEAVRQAVVAGITDEKRAGGSLYR